MHSAVVLLIGLLSVGDMDYARSLVAKELDQPTLDAEGYGEKKALKREDDGLRITFGAGLPETGWKTPQQLKFGGNFRLSASFVIKKMPKPAQEDGVAIGVAIAFQDINQPDVTLVRLREPNNSEVYRPIEKAGANPQQMQMQMQMQMRMGMMGPGQPPPKPPRKTFPATGDVVRLELQREGNTVRYEVFDSRSSRPRYLGQVDVQPMDVSAVKLFASNRNGVEPVDVVFRDITIHADHINGLGTIVRTVFGQIVYADPTAIEGGILVVGGQPKTPPGGAPKAPGGPSSPTPGSAPVPASAPRRHRPRRQPWSWPSRRPAVPYRSWLLPLHPHPPRLPHPRPRRHRPPNRPPRRPSPPPPNPLGQGGRPGIRSRRVPSRRLCSRPRLRLRLRRRRPRSRSMRSRASDSNGRPRCRLASWDNPTSTSPCPA